ncbi:RDD family protein [Isoptericola sp. b441]|uniref:RDD family protein n=1 Tax=Actinotalea lenta TaxID=3064654 RepID=A0ABT9D902_9CELL|nr:MULTISPECIES: RDD family protein [unclassified Isoptericola]MDO8105776.1 RDD family protein [Isoptericola sp. b441]MDO8122481.1 RDD family protein [Isoptericola sp. b490]
MPAAGSVPASLGKRAFARLIDLVAALVLGGGLVVGGVLGQQRAGEPQVSAMTVLGLVALAGQGVVQWSLLGRRGYTLGRVLTGLRVLAAGDGRPIGLGRAFARELCVLVAWSTVLVGLLMTASARRNARRQGWQDRLVGDVVFDVNIGVDPVHAPPTPRQATERLQSLLGDDDRRRHRAAPGRARSPEASAPPVTTTEAAAPPGVVPNGGPAVEGEREVAAVAAPTTVAQGTRVVPRAPHVQRASGSSRGLPEDLERTSMREARSRVAYAPTRAQTRPRATLLLWDNRVVVLEGTALVGRNPAPREGEGLPVQVIAVVDRGRSVSKTHLAIGVDGAGVWLRDRNSTNGTVVTLEDGQQILCAPEQKVRVPVGASVAFGDYWLTVAG